MQGRGLTTTVMTRRNPTVRPSKSTSTTEATTASTSQLQVQVRVQVQGPADPYRRRRRPPLHSPWRRGEEAPTARAEAATARASSPQDRRRKLAEEPEDAPVAVAVARAAPLAVATTTAMARACRRTIPVATIGRVRGIVSVIGIVSDTSVTVMIIDVLVRHRWIQW